MADIAINPVTRRVQFTGNTGTGPFAFTFNILADADIAVYKNTTLLTLTTDYTVTTNANGTGSITLDAGQALVSSDVLTIIGGRDLSRTTDFVTAGDLLASSLNEQLDSLVIMTQQLDEKVGRTIKTNPGDVYTDLELPTKDNRKGTVLGFNATSGDPEVGPTIADVSSLASITADIATLADIEDGTDATDAIQTVAGISSNVSTVAGISSNVTTVAGNTSNINAVAADATDIGTVAGSISNVNTVAGIDSNITTVAGNTTNINTVAGNNSNITTVAGISANVTTVAGISSDVTTVAGISGDVTTVAADGTDIGTVATNIADVNTVASNIATISAKVSKSGDTMTGDLTIQGNLTVSGTTITVDSATAQTIDLGDSDKMRFGDSNDAYIEWNGTYFDFRSTGRFDLLSSGNDLRLSTGTNVGLIVNHTGGTPAVQLYNSGVERLATTSTGIDVTGTVTADGLTVDGLAEISASNTRINLYETDTTDKNTQLQSSNSRLMIKTLSDDGLTATERLRVDHSNGDISFYEDTGTTAKFFWDASAESLGIGTSSPSSALHVSDNVTTGADFYTDANTNLYLTNSGTGNIGVFKIANEISRIVYGQNTTNDKLIFSSRHSAADSSQHVVIDNDGNVGIGTSSPNQNLQVKSGSGGGLTLQANTATQNEYSQLGFVPSTNDAANPNAYIRGLRGATSTATFLTFGTTNLERMRIDSSGNLLVGRTDTGVSTTSKGLEFNNSGYISASRTLSSGSGSVLYANRLTSDGDIVQFRKDGTTVGSIASRSGVVSSIILDPRSNGSGLTGGYLTVVPSDNTGAVTDGTRDLGTNTVRFKDLYLSGGVYLGGTGAANKLDDYEEGTWTPTLRFNQNASGITYTYNDGQYTKIGNMVYVNGIISLTSKGTNTGSATIAGLPFSAGDYLSGTSHENAIIWNYWSNYSDQADPQPRMYASGSNLILWRHVGGTQATDGDFSNGTSMRFSGWYMAS